MAFLDQLEPFYGTGARNRQGQNLEEFLDAYNPEKYDTPSNTTDIIVVRSAEKLVRWGQPIQVLMVKRSNHPSIGFWATPGGFVELREDLEEGARRELEEETGVSGLPLRQMRTWGAWQRDPRWRVITTSFLALVEGDLPVQAGDDADEALWMDVSLSEKTSKDGETLKNLEKTQGIRDIEIWELSLKNPKHGIALHAEVAVCHRGSGILQEEEYRLLSSDGIAVDHGCLITQALLYLKSRLEQS